MATDPAQRQDYAQRWGRLVARAWGDEGFKARLLAEPAAVLAEQGIPLPPGMQVWVHENTATAVHLVLPPHPPSVKGELSDEELEAVAGGFTGLPASYYCSLDPFVDPSLCTGP
jgi:hypothetical protein